VTALAAVASGAVAALLVAGLLGLLPGRRARGRPAGAAARSGSARAKLRVAPADLRAAAAAMALGLVTFLLVVALTQTAAVAAVPALAVALIPRALAARRRSARLTAVRQAWPDALRELSASVGAGRSLTQALHELATDGPEALRGAFARFPILARTVGVPAALEVVRDELADPTTDRVVEVLLLAHEQGGSLVTELLRDLAEATTRDLHVAEEVATNALEHTINARAVFVLPWAVLVVLVTQAEHMRGFYQSAGGLVVIAVGAAASVLGMGLIGRLARHPVEPRVLAGSREGRP